MLRLILITNIPDIAREAENAGVDRIMVDTEVLGKEQRQGAFHTVMNRHTLRDAAAVRPALTRAELIVRVNPLNRNTLAEVETAIDGGADSLMLPMFRSAQEAQDFCDFVRGRCRVILLAETAAAMVRLPSIVRVRGVSEIYIGLNDLRIDMQLAFLHEVTAGGYIEHMAQLIRAAGLSWGFGGIARIGEGDLPAELVLSEHVRLGSQSVILGRVFHRDSRTVEEFRRNVDLKYEIGRLRAAEGRLRTRTPEQVAQDRSALQEIVERIVERATTRAREGRQPWIPAGPQLEPVFLPSGD